MTAPISSMSGAINAATLNTGVGADDEVDCTLSSIKTLRL